MAVAPLSDRKLRRKLARLEGSAIRRVMGPAFTAGAKPIRAAARANVPVRYGFLKKAIGSRVKVYPKNRSVWAGVGVRLGFISHKHGQKIDPNKYGALVEWGTKPHKIGGRIHPGAPASHFLRNAYETKHGEAFAAVARVAESQLRKWAMGA